MRSSPQKTIAFWLILIVGAILLHQFYQPASKTAVHNFNFSKFLTAADKSQLESVTFDQASGRISGKLKPEAEAEYGGSEFSIQGNTGDEVFKLLHEKGIVPNYERADSGSFLQTFLMNVLPLIIVVFIFFLIMRNLQSGGGKAMSFGKSRARLLTENKNKVTFADVAGVDEAKEELEEIIAFLKDPKKFTKLGGRIPKGVLLVGPPGTGKTLLARAVAGEAGVPFFTISGSDFVEMFVGVGASRVRDLFEQGKKHAPCLIFIDEIDAVGRHRGAGMGGGHDEREQTLNQLLVEMDGFASNEGVILIAATNRPDVLDPALLRPGRFDRRVMVGKPDLKGRKMILAVHTRKVPLAKDVEIERIARGTPGFSGADLENLVNESALLAARNNKSLVDMWDFERAKDKVLMGTERRSMVIGDEDKKITAYHEAGHTLAGRLLPGMDPIHKVSIIPRGMALGVTQTLPEEERLNLSKDKAQNMIAFMFGGRAAEEIIFKDYTTGAENDIQRATEIARRMVCEWGMNERLGPLSYEKREGPVFMGMGGPAQREFSEATAQAIDEEVRKLVQGGHDLAVKLLTENLQKLHDIAAALLDLETIDGAEVDIIMKGGSISDLSRDREAKQAKLKVENADKNTSNLAQEEKEARDQKESQADVATVGKGPVIA